MRNGGMDRLTKRMKETEVARKKRGRGEQPEGWVGGIKPVY